MTTAPRFASTKSRELSSTGLRQLLASYRDDNSAIIPDFKMEPGMVYTQVRAISARVNQNFDAWPSEELKKSYRTFLGKPVFVNHQNFDPDKARGRVIAARYVERGDDKYIEVIQEVDGVRFPKLAKEIHEGGMDSVSMGVEAGFTICSYCDNRATDLFDMCDHVKHHKGEKLAKFDPKTGRTEDVMVYERCYKLGFFELSYVFDPADETAVVSRVVVASNKDAKSGVKPRVYVYPDKENYPKWYVEKREERAPEVEPERKPGPVRKFIRDQLNPLKVLDDLERDRKIDKVRKWYRENPQNFIPATASVATQTDWSDVGRRAYGEGRSDDPHRHPEVAAALKELKGFEAEWVRHEYEQGYDMARTGTNWYTAADVTAPPVPDTSTGANDEIRKRMEDDQSGVSPTGGPASILDGLQPGPDNGGPAFVKPTGIVTPNMPGGSSSGGSSSSSSGGGDSSSSSGGGGGGPDTGGSLKPETQALLDVLKGEYPDADIGGWRPPDGFNEHSSGSALDFMTSDSATADAVIQRAFDNGANYVIWNQQLMRPDGSGYTMEDRGSPTQNHMDHVHINTGNRQASRWYLAWSEMEDDENGVSPTGGPASILDGLQPGPDNGGPAFVKPTGLVTPNMPGGSSGGSSSSDSSSGGGSYGGGVTGDGSARDFAHSMMQTWQDQGFTVGDHEADQYGEHQNGAIDVMVPDIESGDRVLQQALQDPNVHGLIWNNQVYGYGNGPDPRPYSAGNTGDATQDHIDHVHIWYQPGGNNIMRAAKRRWYAWGETEAPEDIDTLRDQADDEGDDDFHHYVESPKELQTPDFDQAQRLDRAQEQEGLDADRRVEDIEQVGSPAQGGKMARYRYAEEMGADPMAGGQPPMDPSMMDPSMGGGDPSMGAPGAEGGSMGIEEELALLNQAQGDLEYAESELYGAPGGDPAAGGGMPPEGAPEEMGGSMPPQLAYSRPVRRAASQRKERETQKGRSMGINLSDRGRVASRGRRRHYADDGHVDGGPYGRNDQGEQEEIFLSQTPAEEAPADPVGDKQISNTENTLVARRVLQRKEAELRQAVENYRRAVAGANSPQAFDPRHYERLAALVAGLPPRQRQVMADRMVSMFQSDNRRFNAHTFYDTVRTASRRHAEDMGLVDHQDHMNVDAAGGGGETMADMAGAGEHMDHAHVGRRHYADDNIIEPTTVNPPLSGTDEQSLKGDDFDSVALDDVATQPKDASIHAFAAFDDWLARTTGKTARQHGNANYIRRQAARYIKATGLPLGNLFPTLEKVLVQARKAESTTDRKASTMKRTAEDMKLDVAAPGDRIDVEAPVKNVTDADAQASQYPEAEYGGNASDNLADPVLDTDSQIWAPKSASNRMADAVAAVRCAEAYIHAGLEPESEKWNLVARFQSMRHATVVDRTRLLEQVAQKSAAANQRSAGVSRGTRGVPRGLGSGQRTAQTYRVADNDPQSDSLLFFK